MLAGTYIGGSEEPSVEDCCARCGNTPTCDAWSYCPFGSSEK